MPDEMKLRELRKHCEGYTSPIQELRRKIDAPTYHADGRLREEHAQTIHILASHTGPICEFLDAAPDLLDTIDRLSTENAALKAKLAEAEREREQLALAASAAIAAYRHLNDSQVEWNALQSTIDAAREERGA